MKQFVPARSWQAKQSNYFTFLLFNDVISKTPPPPKPLPAWLRSMAADLLVFFLNVTTNPPTSKIIHVTLEPAASLTEQSVPYDQNPPVILVDAVFVPPC